MTDIRWVPGVGYCTVPPSPWRRRLNAVAAVLRRVVDAVTRRLGRRGGRPPRVGTLFA